MKTIVGFGFLFLFIQCASVNHTSSFDACIKGTKWKLQYGKTDSEIVVFCRNSSECFEIFFGTKKFKRADGFFYIKGLSNDTASMYYSKMDYTGLYDLGKLGHIRLYWVSGISWSMDFSKHKMGNYIACIFTFDGKYVITDSSLIFYKEDTLRMALDTIISCKKI